MQVKERWTEDHAADFLIILFLGVGAEYYNERERKKCNDLLARELQSLGQTLGRSPSVFRSGTPR
jgi:hypothetical protein